ncbi:endolytic transglycosylase MltG [Salibacter halophilus]|uniref:Endolytic murein transglycosylase n=1 Tax=Salibacter halophilus TaxID=1803916 RepID=A0A6N6M640_9FLAO|nr:endolytic transglycosylase MltG [Salibacter halophilus]KAB1063760.1 endolytic transglycosylase MltG [Salibacter halophilus]
MSQLKKIIIALVVLVLVGVGITAYQLYKTIKSPNVNIPKTEDQFFYIRTGASFDDVKQQLMDEGYIINENTFTWVAEKKKYIQNIKPGRYRLEDGMSNNELVNLLRSGRQVPVQVTFNTIRTLHELAGKVSSQLEVDSLSLDSALTDKELMEHYGFDDATFISMFIPNTYEFYWNTNGKEFIERMAQEFKRFWTDERIRKAKEIGLSQSEVATLASIVQQETFRADEMPKVAGLYLNRLERGMKLQADPTVKYAVGDPSLKRIYFKHLKVESPYNTYVVTGLPPGPIAVPERTALDAVLNAVDHNYYYMCAKPDYSGYHEFARTLAQHNRNRAKYIQFLRREGVR